MPSRTRCLIALTAACAAGALTAAPAFGAQKHREVVDRFVQSYDGSVDCTALGPYAFQLDYAGVERVQVTDVRSADGTLLQTVIRVNHRETGTNSVTGFQLPLRGTVHEVWDYEAGTRTLSGAVWMGNQPGGGTYVHDAGRIVLTLDTDEALFTAGKKEAYFGDLDSLVCAALAAG